MTTTTTPITVDSLREHQSGLIIGFLAEPTEIAKLLALGIMPGLTVTVTQRFPSYVLTVGQTQYAVDAALASKIQVEVLA